MMVADLIKKYETVVESYRKVGGEAFERVDLDNALISSTHHSAAIEGNTFTLDETYSFVKTGQVVPGHSHEEHADIKDLYKAHEVMVDFAREKVSMSESLVLALHKEVLRTTLPEKAGKYKEIANRVGRYTTPYPEKAKELFRKAIADFNKLEGEIHPLELAARFHFDLVYTHPFTDGNGRTARLCMNYALLKHNYPFLNIKVQEKPEYFKAIVKSREEKSYDPFSQFICELATGKVKEKKLFLEKQKAQKKTSKKTGDLGSASDIFHRFASEVKDL